MNITTLYHEPRVYAYTLPEVPKLNGWIKVGYTDKQTVAERIAQQLKTVGILPFRKATLTNRLDGERNVEEENLSSY